MDVRPYLTADREACLALFDSNTPQYFHISERSGFEQFLTDPQCPYFVMEWNGELVGCGGYDLSGEIASLVWGIIRHDFHRQGLGRYLLLFRLREIGRAGTFPAVQVDTSQIAAPFFAKQGFRTMEVIPDGWAPGYDRVPMLKKLTVCP